MKQSNYHMTDHGITELSTNNSIRLETQESTATFQNCGDPKILQSHIATTFGLGSNPVNVQLIAESIGALDLEEFEIICAQPSIKNFIESRGGEFTHSQLSTVATIIYQTASK